MEDITLHQLDRCTMGKFNKNIFQAKNLDAYFRWVI